MGTPGDHLPPALSAESVRSLLQSVSLPTPTAIISPKVLAQYHSIYIVSFPRETLPDIPPDSSGTSDTVDLILRVSGPHIPKIKTENEVAVISWILANTTIPVPYVIRYDSSIDNPIGHEYILMSKSAGKSLDTVYKSLTPHEISDVIDQLIDVLAQLHNKEWVQIGGLRFVDGTADIAPGPVLEETFWQIPDIAKCWGSTETFETLNIGGPFNSYVEYVSASIDKYVYAITRHDSLSFMRDTLPRLEAFPQALSNDDSELNRVKLRLAHKDLHFGNIMYDVASSKITAILDWEFAGIVPFTRWNPTRAFLWNGEETDASMEEKNALYAVFSDRCAARGITIPEDAEFSSPKQEHMQKAVNFLRAIVEVSPRGQKKDAAQNWKQALSENMLAFGV